MTNLKPHTFAEMAGELADVRIGDTVYASVDRRVEPSRYTVFGVGSTQHDAIHKIYLRGMRGSECSLEIAAAEQRVWLRRGRHCRRVIQAWRESAHPEASPAKPTLLVGEAVLPSEDYKVVPITGGCCYEVRIRATESVDRGPIRDVLLEAVADAWSHALASAKQDAAAKAERVAADRHEFDLAHAALGRKLSEVERDRDECRIALGQIRNVVYGTLPGTMPLPSNSIPANVVIDVTAALLRARSGETDRPVVADFSHAVRTALAWALPRRMQDDPQP